MAAQKPLVLVAGQLQQLAAVDTLTPAALGAGTPDGTKYLRDDSTWQTPAGITLATARQITTLRV